MAQELGPVVQQQLLALPHLRGTCGRDGSGHGAAWLAARGRILLARASRPLAWQLLLACPLTGAVVTRNTRIVPAALSSASSLHGWGARVRGQFGTQIASTAHVLTNNSNKLLLRRQCSPGGVGLPRHALVAVDKAQHAALGCACSAAWCKELCSSATFNAAPRATGRSTACCVANAAW